jgi:UDP:flavonoid glycosyltransferase YjiC (YdhE family)
VADAGTRLPAQRLTAERLRNQVRLAITKRDGAQRVADGFRASRGAHAAADAFETVMAASNTNTPSQSPTRS